MTGKRSTPTKDPVARERDPQLNYRQTLITLQQHFFPARAAFSRFIHRPAVENLSDLLDATLLRPGLLLGALIGGLAVEGSFYLAGRHFGFALSGSEVLIALLIGAIIGLLLEMLGGLGRRS